MLVPYIKYTLIRCQCSLCSLCCCPQVAKTLIATQIYRFQYAQNSVILGNKMITQSDLCLACLFSTSLVLTVSPPTTDHVMEATEKRNHRCLTSRFLSGFLLPVFFPIFLPAPSIPGGPSKLSHSTGACP